jgi:predicted AAA+ superfamily ATPase
MQIRRVLGERLPTPKKRRLVIVTGARQTGKTTLLKAVYPDLRHVTFDVLENREWARQISTFDWAAQIGPAVIDEAQKEPSVFEKVKYAYDERALPFSVLSGSTQITLLALAGRAFVHELCR